MTYTNMTADNVTDETLKQYMTEWQYVVSGLQQEFIDILERKDKTLVKAWHGEQGHAYKISAGFYVTRIGDKLYEIDHNTERHHSEQWDVREVDSDTVECYRTKKDAMYFLRLEIQEG